MHKSNFELQTVTMALYLVNPADDAVHAEELHEPVYVELDGLAYLKPDAKVLDSCAMAHFCK